MIDSTSDFGINWSFKTKAIFLNQKMEKNGQWSLKLKQITVGENKLLKMCMMYGIEK